MPIAIALAAVTLNLTDRPVVALAAPVVRIADVTSDAGSIGSVVIAKLPRGHAQVALSRRALAALIHRAVPGVEVADGGMAGTISFSVPAPPPVAVSCLIAKAPIAQGATVTADKVDASPCTGRAAVNLVAYDRGHRAVVARRSIAAGANLGAMRPPEPLAVRTGDRLMLVSRAGPVMVERPVVAMQPGREGRSVFVRDGAGKVSSVAFSGASR